MYIDCSIPWGPDQQHFKERIEFLYRNGYQGAIVDLRSINEYRQLCKSGLLKRRPCEIEFPISIKTFSEYRSESLPIPIAPKITLSPKNAHQLKRKLGLCIKEKVLVEVESDDKNTLEVAARDGRVDIISAKKLKLQKSLTKGIISLIKQNENPILINLTHLIYEKGFHRSRKMREFYKLFKRAKWNTHKYIFGTCMKDPWKIRGPKEHIALLHSLFEIPEYWAKQIIRKNGEELIMRYMKRDLGLFIESGTEIVDKKNNPDEKSNPNTLKSKEDQL